ncbi:zinc finger protein zic and gli [Anaeramoeba flamelloides]|uniref:Zinc finger protein zic and gli n=1 Tax=Anaeramoeba flamelloides TaxID=1746091 RepID=A0AAV7Y7L4_9EUKA|nr:zinc finger protein zic and gli [Anaeramoeba flamelloides]
MDFSFEYDTQQFNGFFEDLEQVFNESNIDQNESLYKFGGDHPNKNNTISGNDNYTISNDFDMLANENLEKSISFSDEENIPFDLETSLTSLNNDKNGDDNSQNNFQFFEFPETNLNLESNELDLSIISTQLPNEELLLQEANETNKPNRDIVIGNNDKDKNINTEQNSHSISSTNPSSSLSSTFFEPNCNTNNISNNNNNNKNNSTTENNNMIKKNSNTTKNKNTIKKKPNKTKNNKIKNNNIKNNNNSETNDDISNIKNNKRSNPRKRRLRNQKSNQQKRTDSYIIESGKEVFKLLTGQLWTITGGAPQKVLTPFTKELAKNIGNVFKANKLEIDNFQSQLKYLLSNSRRTFTEFILEILISVLSLHYSTETTPEITTKFRRILKDVITINKNKNTNMNMNMNMNMNNKGGNSKDNLQNDQLRNEKQNNEQDSNGIKLQLEEIYHEIFTQDVLMYWFSKRFIDRLSSFFPVEEQQKFFSKHLFFLGKSKFILSCLLLAKDLMKPHGIVEQYSQLINLNYDENPLNLYCNNRGKKLKLVKNLITKYSLNNGNYWSVISKDYISRIKFTTENICQFSPFKQIFENNKLVQLSKKNNFNHPHKKRTLASKDNEVQVQINVDWLSKTGIF